MTRRPIDSGRLDSRGRPVKVSDQDSQHRADAPTPPDGAGLTVEHLHGPACPECNAFEPEMMPVYECGECGSFTSDDGNRCPQCNKFASRGEMVGCAECGSELDTEPEPQDWWRTSDGELHTTLADAEAWADDAAVTERAEKSAAAKARMESELAAHMNEINTAGDRCRTVYTQALDRGIGLTDRTRQSLEWSMSNPHERSLPAALDVMTCRDDILAIGRLDSDASHADVVAAVGDSGWWADQWRWDETADYPSTRVGIRGSVFADLLIRTGWADDI